MTLATGLLLLATPATAATPEAAWTIHSFPAPTAFSAAATTECLGEGGFTAQNALCDGYQITATDAGALPMAAEPVTITDTLPAGLEVQEIRFYAFRINGTQPDLAQLHLCTAPPVTTPATVSCTIPSSLFSLFGPVQPDQVLRMEVLVTVEEGLTAGSLTDAASVSGGGAPEATTTSENRISDTPAPFGFTGLLNSADGPDGAPDTQAGSHPYELHTRVDLASDIRVAPSSSETVTSTRDPRDIVVDLPAGLAGSALSTPATCTLSELTAGEVGGGESGCPADSVIGHLTTQPSSNASVNGPLYNITPEHGVAAEFGYIDALKGAHILYASLAPTPQGYVLRTTAPQVPQVNLTSIEVNIYGDPLLRKQREEERAAEAAARKEELERGEPVAPRSVPAAPADRIATFTDPAECDGRPLVTQIHADSWQDPGRTLPGGGPDLSDPAWASATSTATPPVTGCNQLAGLFRPTITATPETDRGDTPTGLEVDLRVPQQEGPETLATPPLKKAEVTLPEGMSVNPSSANGLEACSLAQIGVSASGVPDGEAIHCPEASKIGTVELETPAVAGVLEGQIYVARQSENPFGTLLALYIVVNDPRTGVLVKLPAEVKADPRTGQLTTVVDDSPQFPFSELRTHFFGGQRAALRTPAVCGTYTVTSSLTPWSAPESGPPATPSSSFRISQGCAPSAGQEPDSPGFSAGTATPTAGIFSPLGIELHREDGSQEPTSLSLTLPPGLIGRLAGISECPDAALAAAASKTGTAEQQSPSCPSSSEVGRVTVGAGAGLEPYFTTGRAYLAGPYKGAPLSVAIVTPAVAGPYDLGDVVVRAALELNLETTQITAVSDEIPHILQGIPLDLRSIAIDMDRPDFTLNPTNCEKRSITGSLTTVLGSSAALSNPFQVGGCKSLKFRPALKLSLAGSTRHAGHPALKATLTYPKGPGYANIARAQVNLPHSEFIDQGNLDKTCTRPVLQAGDCPASTVYGHAEAWTPLLEAPLQGPVYLVGGYGYKLPALVAELGGQIRVLLVGRVDSGKNKGIRSTFEAVPDAPVEKFVLQMKGGKRYSLLENSEDLCARKQVAIARFTAQDGAVETLHPRIADSCRRRGGPRRHGKGATGRGGRGGGHGARHRAPKGPSGVGR